MLTVKTPNTSAKPRLVSWGVIQAFALGIFQWAVGKLADWSLLVILGVGAIGVPVSAIFIGFLQVDITVPLWSGVAGSLILLIAIPSIARLRELTRPPRSQTQRTARFPRWHQAVGFRWKFITVGWGPEVEGPYCPACYGEVSQQGVVRYEARVPVYRYVCWNIACGRELRLEFPMEELKKLGEEHVLAKYRKYEAEKDERATGPRR